VQFSPKVGEVIVSGGVDKVHCLLMACDLNVVAGFNFFHWFSIAGNAGVWGVFGCDRHLNYGRVGQDDRSIG